MTCRAAVRPHRRYRVTFTDPWGARFEVVVTALDAGSATGIGLAQLARAYDWDDDPARWVWVGTAQVGPALAIPTSGN